MNESNRDLLDQVINQNLTEALNAKGGSEEAKTYFRQAMDAIDRQINLNKVDCTYQENYDKLESETKRLEEIDKAKLDIESQKMEIERQEIEIEKQKIELERLNRDRDDQFRNEDTRNAMIFRCIELGCSCLIAPIVGYCVNRKLSKVIMRWEEGNTFITTPGKSLKGMFKFGK